MANPNWFIAKDYLAAKLAQLQATEPTKGWTAESLNTTLEAAGYKGDEGAFNHFNDFGMDENVSPNASFDATFYLNAKAAQLNELNVDGKAWTAVSVMDAIKAAGMNSAWEHFDKFGSQEGVSTSATFDTAAYFVAKTALMNETAEGGRGNWTIDEVKAAFAEQGLNAVEHYNLYGQAEFKAAGVAETFHTATTTDTAKGFDPYTGVQTYDTLILALEAQETGALADKYAITSATEAGSVTVAQQAGLQALLAGATPTITTTPTYTLDDTVAAIAAVSSPILMGSKDGYNITDSLANVATGNDALVNSADTATATVAFGAKAAGVDPVTEADVVTTTVKYADIAGNQGTNAEITIAHADAAVNGVYANKGDAVVAVDGSGTTAVGTEGKSFDLNKVFAVDAGVTANTLTFNVTGSDKADFITAHANGGVITGGKGADTMIAGNGADTFVIHAGDSGITVATADSITSFATGADKLSLGLAGDATASTGNYVEAGAAVADFGAALTAANTALGALNASSTAAKLYAFEADATNGYLFIDQNSDGTADNVIVLVGVAADGFAATDIVA